MQTSASPDCCVIWSGLHQNVILTLNPNPDPNPNPNP